MYSVTIKKEIFKVDKGKDGLMVNGTPILWDLVKTDQKSFHVIHHNTSYLVELLAHDPSNKKLVIRMNGKSVTLSVKDRFDLLLDEMGMNLTDVGILEDIKAPMPGLILDIMVSEGDFLKKGEPVLVLEAMKMENTIKSSGEGLVKSVKVAVGDSVEKSQVLVQF